MQRFSVSDAAICKSVEKSHSGSNEEISPYSIGKLKGPSSFTIFVTDCSKNFLESQFSFDLICSFIGGIPQDKDVNQLPLVGSWAHFNN